MCAWSAGTFSRALGPNQWQNDAAASVGIQAGIHDTQDNDLATGINDCLNKNGQNSLTAPISLGGFNFTNVGNATARNQFPSFGQVQDGAGKFGGTSAGSAAAQTITLTPALPAYADGQAFYFVAGFANTGPATLSINGLAAVPILNAITGAALVAGAVTLGMRCEVLYSGGNFYLLNPATIPMTNVTGAISSWVPTVTFPGTLSASPSVVQEAVYEVQGAWVHFVLAYTGTLSGAGIAIFFTPPTPAVDNSASSFFPCVFSVGGAAGGFGVWNLVTGIIEVGITPAFPNISVGVCRIGIEGKYRRL